MKQKTGTLDEQTGTIPENAESFSVLLAPDGTVDSFTSTSETAVNLNALVKRVLADEERERGVVHFDSGDQSRSYGYSFQQIPGDLKLISFHDITGWTELRRRAEYTASLQREVKNAIPDIFILKDIQGKWMEWNRTAEEYRKSSPFCTGGTPVLTPGCRESDALALESGKTVRRDEVLPDGTVFDVAKTVLRDREKQPVGILVTARNVTASRRREVKLTCLNRLLETLKKIDRLIIGCRTPESLLNGTVDVLLDSGVLEKCSVVTAPFSEYSGVFVPPASAVEFSMDALMRMDDCTWADSLFFSGMDAPGETLPGSWIMARISCEGTFFGYFLCRPVDSFRKNSGISIESTVSDLVQDIAYALYSMKIISREKSSAERARSSLAMLDSFIENYPGPAFIRDHRSVYLKVNGNLERLFQGVELLGKLPAEIYPPENCEILAEMDREVLEKGYVTRLRELDSPEGGTCQLETHYFRIDSDNGAPLIGGIAMDITERLKARRKLAESEEKYRTIYENTGTAMATIDKDGVIQSVNDTAVDLTGFSREEICGTKHWSEFVHPGDVHRVGENRSERLQSEASRQFNYGFRLVRKDGSHRYVRIRTGTIPNSGGTGVMSLTDVTSLMDYQDQLNRSLEKTQAILEAIPDLMFVLDREGRYRDFHTHDESMLAIPAEEIGDHTVLDIGIPGKTAEELIHSIQETIDTGRVHHVTYQLELPDGLHHYEAGMSPFEEDSVLVLCRDVTARKKAEAEQKNLEAQVRHVQKLESLGVLAGGIAHDFNNLLMAITGNIYLARKAIEQNGSPDSYLDSVEQAAGRASELAGQMLAYSGRGEFSIGPVDLNEIAGEMAGILTATVSKKAEMVYSLDEEIPLILADGTQIRQVIMNLITNASEALEGNRGRITISSGLMYCDPRYLATLSSTEKMKPGRYAWLQVEDTGKGIEKENLGRIFDPFFTTKFTGRGLGLSAVLGIMNGHSGALKIDSVPGEGSCFRALFPVGSPEGTEFPEQGIETGSLDCSGLVLFVDDEPVIRSVATEILGSMGFDVLTAEDGLKGLQAFMEHSETIRLVILDLTMPNMDGEEVFSEIKKVKPDVPVLVSSGYNENEILNRFSGNPPGGFLKKPYSPLEMQNKIRTLLDP